MYYKHITHESKDDADFDEIEDFDYIGNFIEEDKDEHYRDLDMDPEEIDDLDDLFIDDDDNTDSEEDDDDLELIDDTKKNIEIHIVCETCGHKWVDFVSEEENESDFGLFCPLCGSSDISRVS